MAMPTNQLQILIETEFNIALAAQETKFEAQKQD